MTVREAIIARGMRICDLNRASGISRPTIDSIIGSRKARHKEGVRTGTLLKIAEVLNATIVIDGEKPDYFDVILKGVKEE